MKSKTIVYPTDFSNCAENAMTYAIAMAVAMKCNIKVIHFMDTSEILESGENPLQFLREIEILEKKAERRLKDIAIKILTNGITCEIEVLKGDRFSWLSNYLKDNNPDLLVMGTQGSNNLENKIFGSLTYKAIRNTGIPTMAIPEKASFKGLQKTIFATDYQKSDIYNLKLVVKIAEFYKTAIIVVHITKVNLSKVERHRHESDLKNEILKSILYSNLDTMFLYSTNVARRLEILVKESNADLLVLVTKRRSFLDHLFSKSLTKSMVHHTQTPLLIF